VVGGLHGFTGYDQRHNGAPEPSLVALRERSPVATVRMREEGPVMGISRSHIAANHGGILARPLGYPPALAVSLTKVLSLAPAKAL
jgi:hypothetical protein